MYRQCAIWSFVRDLRVRYGDAEWRHPSGVEVSMFLLYGSGIFFYIHHQNIPKIYKHASPMDAMDGCFNSPIWTPSPTLGSWVGSEFGTPVMHLSAQRSRVGSR